MGAHAWRSKARAVAAVLVLTLLCAACGRGQAPEETLEPTLAPTSTPEEMAATATPTVTAEPTTEPTTEPTATRAMSPTPTATATPGAVGADSGGRALEFTHSVASGLATLEASATSCSGIRGPWDGTFEVELNYQMMHIGGSGTWAFSLPEGELSATGEAPFTGSGSLSGTVCTIPGVADPLRFEITFSEDGRTAEVMMGSYGGGTLTVHCKDAPPMTIPFAIAWGPDPLQVPVTDYEGCP